MTWNYLPVLPKEITKGLLTNELKNFSQPVVSHIECEIAHKYIVPFLHHLENVYSKAFSNE